ncbi:MAG: hypothetical protein MRERV_5c064 [Mycoplasmataceae bacterium RV_VA103A]|nr:MAG: hypothetical protein MRERV_5c064 [Mycoplasmataceae bacterium RV_VA103A]
MSNQFNNQKKCRISGCSCTYEIIPGYKDLGVCKCHSKRCQGVISGQWQFTDEGTKWRYVKEQCDIAVPIDGGDFCEGCKNQTETYQTWKTRTEAEGKQIFEKLCQVHEKAQSWWSALSPQEKERECERLAEKIIKRGYTASGWAHTGSFWGIENGKITSSNPNLVPIEIIQEFAEKEIGFCDSKMIEYFESQMVVKKNNGDSSPIVNNPTYLNQSPQPENNHTGQSAKINANDTNQQSPKIGRELTESREPEKKKAEIAKDNKENGLNKNELLVIDLKNVKKIILRDDGKLEIEFDNTQNDNCSIIQVITDEQIKDNQELQKIKNYCQKNGKNSLNQQELNNILNSSSTYNLTNKPVNNNYMLAIGLSIAVALVVGLTIGLLLKRKNIKKSNIF